MSHFLSIPTPIEHCYDLNLCWFQGLQGERGDRGPKGTVGEQVGRVNDTRGYFVVTFYNATLTWQEVVRTHFGGVLLN